MLVSIISDGPNVTTGFGTTCREIVEALSNAGHKVSCFGLWVFGETFDRSRFPCSVWACGANPSPPLLALFLRTEKPQVIVINADFEAIANWVSILRAIGWEGDVIGHLVADGFVKMPHKTQTLLSTLAGVVVPTRATRDWLESECPELKIVVAPHGVDSTVFYPRCKEELKRRAGLLGHYVVGVFARNSERKQQPRVLEAFRQLLDGPWDRHSSFMYLHCQAVDDPTLFGWNLDLLAKQMGIRQEVRFLQESYAHIMGPPLRHDSNGPQQSLLYPELLCLCDMIINVPFSGGFELIILEAQACGIPLIQTDDQGNMAEVAGNGAFLLSGGPGWWSNGASQTLVAPDHLAVAMDKLRNDDSLALELVRLGHLNCKSYGWAELRGAIVHLVNERASG